MVWEFALPSMIRPARAGGDTLHSQPREKSHGYALIIQTKTVIS